MKHRAAPDERGDDALPCRCERPLVQRVIDGGEAACLKCGREVEGAHATQGLLERARRAAAPPVLAAVAARLPSP